MNRGIGDTENRRRGTESIIPKFKSMIFPMFTDVCLKFYSFPICLELGGLEFGI